MEQTTAPPSTSQPQPPEAEPNPPPPPSPSPTSSTAANASSVALPSPATPSLLPPASTTPLQYHHSPTQNPHPPATATPPSQTTPHVRPSTFNRPWQQQQPPPPPSSPFAPYSLPPVPAVPHHPPSTANSASPSIPILPPPTQRGGMAIGVPAAHDPGAPAPTAPASFPPHNPPFGQAFGGIGRNVTDSGPTSSSPQARPTVGGNQGMGMMGSSSSLRPPAGGPATLLRPVQSSPRPQSNPSIQPPHTQILSLQGHAMLRPTSVGSPGAPSPGPLQSPQPQNQSWLNSGSQARPPLPPTSLRPQVTPQSLHLRPHAPQQHHHSTNTTSQQQQPSPSQQSQQPSTSGPQEHHGQHPPSKIQQSSPNQQQIARSLSLGTQRPSQTTIPSTAVQSSLPIRAASAEPEESCNRILRKRTIQELVTQVDPSEKLDPEVEDILVDIAEDFVESITAFGCSLAKHRKSTMLEAKDILLHLERNWNVTLPGFSGDEIKTYRKPFTSDIHRERLAVIKKSILASDTMSSKSTAGQAGGNPKGHFAKGPANLVGSPPTKVREAA